MPPATGNTDKTYLHASGVPMTTVSPIEPDFTDAGWTLVKRVRSASPSITRPSAGAAGRGTFEKVVVGQGEISIDYEMTRDPDDTEYQTVRDAFYTGTVLGWAELDGVIQPGSGDTTNGIVLDVHVTQFDESSDRTNARMVSFTVEPAAEGIDPEAVEITGA